MTSRLIALAFCFIAAIVLVDPGRAALIEFSTLSPSDARYQLTIIGDTSGSGLTDLAPGNRLDLSGLGQRYAGTYSVIALRHGIINGDPLTRFTLRRQEGTLVDGRGGHDINLSLWDYDFRTAEIRRGGTVLTSFNLIRGIPEAATLLPLALALAMLLVFVQGRARPDRGALFVSHR